MLVQRGALLPRTQIPEVRGLTFFCSRHRAMECSGRERRHQAERKVRRGERCGACETGRE